MKGACLSHCQRVIRRCKRWLFLPGVSQSSPRKGVQRNLPLMRPLFNLDQSEVSINPRLGGGTRYFKHRASFDHQTAPHLRLLTIVVEHHESELGVSRSNFWKGFLYPCGVERRNSENVAFKASRAISTAGGNWREWLGRHHP